jgi:hypothetical protein
MTTNVEQQKATIVEQQRAELRRRISDSLEQVSVAKKRLKRNISRCSMGSIVSSFLTALITGQATVLKTPSMGGNWRIVCIIAAALSAAAALMTGVQKQIADPELFGKLAKCVVRLEDLLETFDSGGNVEQVRKEYKQIRADYPEVDW